jgi:hypothetical protein
LKTIKVFGLSVIHIPLTVGFSQAISENAQQDIYEAKQLRLAICQDEDFPLLVLLIYLILIQRIIEQVLGLFRLLKTEAKV